MSATWTARLCVNVPGRGIIATRSPWGNPPEWKFPGGQRVREKDTTWKDTAVRATYRETGIRVSRRAITPVTVDTGGTRPVYIGLVIVLERDMGTFGPLPGVEEESRFVSFLEFLTIPNFLPRDREIALKYGLFF